MTKRSFGLLTAAAVVALTLTAVGSARAAEKKPQANHGVMETVGDITAMDATAGTLTVKDKDGEKHYLVPASAKVYIKNQKESVKFDALKVGMAVRVRYSQDSKGVLIADMVGQQGANADTKANRDARHSATQ